MNCKIMKRTLTYIGLALAAAVAIASCDKNLPPKFDDKDAFVAFDNVTMTVAENYTTKNDGATVKVPVTLASVAGLEATIKFTVIEPEKKAAKAGVNYELETTSGTLTFNAENRTQYIEFKTLEDGVYTGDLSFNIELSGTETISVGSENVCTVKISDIDHPLSFMLGDYTMSGVKYKATSATTWTMTILKDESDATKVWFDNLFGNSGWAGDDMRYYGVVSQVSEDTYKLNIPFGQESEYKYSNGKPVKLYGLTSDLKEYDSGSVDVVVKVNGTAVTLDFGNEYGLWFYIEDAGGIGAYLPGLSAVKN